MSKTLTAASTWTFIDDDGITQKITTTRSVTYTAVVEGGIPLVDGAVSMTVPIPFGKIEKATGIEINNESGQDVVLLLNGTPLSGHVANKGRMQYLVGSPTADFIANASVTLLSTQAGAGSIGFKVFGNPA